LVVLEKEIILIGPNVRSSPFRISPGSFVCPEVDGVRIISNKTNEILRK